MHAWHVEGAQTHACMARGGCAGICMHGTWEGVPAHACMACGGCAGICMNGVWRVRRPMHAWHVEGVQALGPCMHGARHMDRAQAHACMARGGCAGPCICMHGTWRLRRHMHAWHVEGVQAHACMARGGCAGPRPMHHGTWHVEGVQAHACMAHGGYAGTCMHGTWKICISSCASRMDAWRMEDLHIFHVPCIHGTWRVRRHMHAWDVGGCAGPCMHGTWRVRRHMHEWRVEGAQAHACMARGGCAGPRPMHARHAAR